MLDSVAETHTDASRHDWTREEVDALFALPFTELLFRAQTVHRQYHRANAVQASQLCSIKTGGCPEDCGYCNQSAKFKTGLTASRLMAVEAVVAEAEAAKAGGASRFCMGAAWREPKDRDMDALTEMVSRVKAMGLETCMTLGMLSDGQAQALSDAGLDYYNHNIDTSPKDYGRVISTRTFEDRIETLERVRQSGMKVCCGGIIGMGEQAEDRAGLLIALARMTPHPESVPINALVPVRGTPLGDEVLDGEKQISGIEFARVIAVARIMMPTSMVRLSAGREAMSDETQALCFAAGANSIFVGERLLTTDNPGESRDEALFRELGLELF
ncbi:biotin synthase BioB [Parvularcula flava]|uniref:Biotin synthase n=1 Tax=Aquisalinus luteolus TaxID=1566827 RepID=A0A8J3A690_9PROT|nr:biotin synthase BioB [Aquisalinus luteolus]NHK29416.1 biotin synthase BioB [Aquisalinus luteolus]GGI02014.1 biotin synthase [Aquisalinus luteolus]